MIAARKLKHKES